MSTKGITKQKINHPHKEPSSLRDLEAIYSTYFNIETLKYSSIDEAIDIIGTLIDVSFDLSSKEGLYKALELANEIRDRGLSSTQICILYYFLGNAWENLRHLSRSANNKYEWENDEIEHEITYLRKALTCKGFIEIEIDRQCQILVNLGNLMDSVGRFIESIEYKNTALELKPDFPMALGAKGVTLFHYGNVLYDVGHKIVFFKFARYNLKEALSSSELHLSASSAFEKYVNIIDSLLKPEQIKKHIDMDNFSLGNTDEEIRYRKWCLENSLFLNPLNDLGPYAVADCDVLGPPPIITPINGGVNYFGYFNQLKQEFISARYLFYESISACNLHFSDKDARIFNTYDFPSYSLSSEKMKVAFKTTYSIFDKIAYLLKLYFNLPVSENSVSFRNLWGKTLRKKFRYRNNLPLLGLFLLSKDLFEDKPGFRTAIEPEAQKLSEIRNNIKHRYFKLHTKRLFESHYFLNSLDLNDSLAYSMFRPEFEQKTLKLLKLVRAALIYLSLAIYIEEINKKKFKGEAKIINEEIDTLEDSYRI
jgi:hypothetical protein